MDFSQYLQDYMTIKQLRGKSPGTRTSQAIFSPYFDRKSRVDLAGRRLNLAEKSQAAEEKQASERLAFRKENTLESLALEKWHQQQLMNQAARGDTKTGIGNLVNTAGSFGNLYLMKKYGYLK
jgi:hypothetical protein